MLLSMNYRLCALLVCWSVGGCANSPVHPEGPYLLLLGVTQDAGYPQPGCYAAHCERGWQDPNARRLPVALGLVQPSIRSKALFEATPAIGEQLRALHEVAPDPVYSLDGIFLTHAHIGHYAGLMYLGREAMGSAQTPVFAMPRMLAFLRSNGPWDQLIKLNNISPQPLHAEQPVPIGTESMAELDALSREERGRVWFIHFNHSNPLIDPDSASSRLVQDAGFNVATEGVTLPL